jgi:hypothetical protein
MLEAVYIDLAASRSIVGIPPLSFVRSSKSETRGKVTLFNPRSNKTKDSALDIQSDNFDMVDTGESWSLPETILYFV